MGVEMREAFEDVLPGGRVASQGIREDIHSCSGRGGFYALDAATGKELRHYEKSAREAVGVSPDGKNWVYCKSMWHTITSVDAASLEVDWCAETGAGYEISPTSIVRIGNEVIMPTERAT